MQWINDFLASCYSEFGYFLLVKLIYINQYVTLSSFVIHMNG